MHIDFKVCFIKLDNLEHYGFKSTNILIYLKILVDRSEELKDFLLVVCIWNMKFDFDSHRYEASQVIQVKF